MDTERYNESAFREKLFENSKKKLKLNIPATTKVNYLDEKNRIPIFMDSALSERIYS
jgi:malate synthase